MYGLSNRSDGYGSRAFYARLAVWCCALFFGFQVSAGTYAVVWYGDTIVTGVGDGWRSGTIHVISSGTNEIDALTHLYGGLSAENWESTSQVNPLSGTTGWACPQFCWVVGSPSWISNGHNYSFFGWIVKVSGKKGTYVQNIGGSSQPISYYAGKPLFICACCDRGYMLGGWDPVPYHCAIVNDAVVPPYIFQNPQLIAVGSMGGPSANTIDSVDANTVSPAGDNLVLNDGVSTNDLWSSGNTDAFSNTVSNTSASDMAQAFYAKFHPDFSTLGNGILLGNKTLGDINSTLLSVQNIASAGNVLLKAEEKHGSDNIYYISYINSKMDTVNGNLGTANSWLSQIKTLNSSILSQLQTGSGSSVGSVDLTGVRSDVQGVKSSVDALSGTFGGLSDPDIPDDGGFVAPTDTGAADAQARADAVSQQFEAGSLSGDSAIGVIGSLVGGLYGQWAGLGSVAPDITVAFNLPATGPFKGLNWSYHFDFNPYSELIGLLRKVEALALWLFLAWKVRALLATLFD